MDVKRRSIKMEFTEVGAVDENNRRRRFMAQNPDTREMASQEKD